MSLENGEERFGDIADLVEASLRGDLTEERRVRLEALVRDDPEARRVYVRYLHDSHSLRTWAEQPARKARPFVRRGPQRRVVAAGLIVGLAAALLLGIVFLAARTPGETRRAPSQGTSKAPPPKTEDSSESPRPSPDRRKEAEDRLADAERKLREAEREKRQAEDAKEQERLRKAEEGLKAIADAFRKAQEDLAKAKAEERKPAAPEEPPKKKESPPSQPAIAQVERSEGQVWRVRDAERKPLTAGEALLKGEGLQTAGGTSLAVLKYPDGSRIELGPETAIRELEGEGGKRFVVPYGIVRGDVEKQPQGQPMTVLTPGAKAVVLGTQFTLSCGADSTLLHVSEGRVQLTRQKDGKSVVVSKGEHAEVAPTADFAARKGVFARIAYRWDFDANTSAKIIGELLRLSEPAGDVTAVASVRFPPEKRRPDIGWEPDVEAGLLAEAGLLFEVPKDFELRLRMKAERKGEFDVSLRHVTMPAGTRSKEVSQTRQRAPIADRWTEVVLRVEDFKAFVEAPGFPAAPGVAGPQAAVGELNIYGYGTGRLTLDRILLVSAPRK